MGSVGKFDWCQVPKLNEVKLEISIREFKPEDWVQVWPINEAVFRVGDTYAIDRDISEVDGYKYWIESPDMTYVAESEDGQILGSCYLTSNQAGGGSHICNCGFIVGEKARGKGVASAMCEHAQRAAIEKGYRGMQYNFVVSTNEVGIRLWKKLGFEIIGTIPAGFEHPKLGFVDVYIMFKKLI